MKTGDMRAKLLLCTDYFDGRTQAGQSSVQQGNVKNELDSEVLKNVIEKHKEKWRSLELIPRLCDA